MVLLGLAALTLGHPTPALPLQVPGDLFQLSSREGDPNNYLTFPKPLHPPIPSVPGTTRGTSNGFSHLIFEIEEGVSNTPVLQLGRLKP